MSKEHRQRQILKRVYGGTISVKLLRSDSLIAIDGGTTNTIAASLIPRSLPIRVVTKFFSSLKIITSINVISKFMRLIRNEVFLLLIHTMMKIPLKNFSLNTTKK